MYTAIVCAHKNVHTPARAHTHKYDCHCILVKLYPLSVQYVIHVITSSNKQAAIIIIIICNNQSKQANPSSYVITKSNKQEMMMIIINITCNNQTKQARDNDDHYQHHI